MERFLIEPDLIDSEPLERRPIKRSFCDTLKQEANIKCFILTSLIVSCLCAITWCRLTRNVKIDIDFSSFPIARSREASPCDDGYFIIPCAFIVMLYLLYLVECWYSSAWTQLRLQKLDVSTAYRKIHEMQSAKPMLWWKAVNYHYVKRRQTETHIQHRKRKMHTETTTKIKFERVNSHLAAGCFYYTMCGMKDVTPELIDLEKYTMTKIKFSKGLLFANSLTVQEYKDQRTLFFQEQENKDHYMEMKEGLDFARVHFKTNMIVWSKPDDPPWFARPRMFWILNLLLLSWPLRLILQLNTGHVHLPVRKIFGRNYDVNEREPSAHASSEDILQTDENHLQPDHQIRTYGRDPLKDKATAASFNNKKEMNGIICDKAHDPVVNRNGEMYPNFFNTNTSPTLPPHDETWQKCFSPPKKIRRSVTFQILRSKQFFDANTHNPVTVATAGESSQAIEKTNYELDLAPGVPSYSQAVLSSKETNGTNFHPAGVDPCYSFGTAVPCEAVGTNHHGENEVECQNRSDQRLFYPCVTYDPTVTDTTSQNHLSTVQLPENAEWEDQQYHHASETQRLVRTFDEQGSPQIDNQLPTSSRAGRPTTFGRHTATESQSSYSISSLALENRTPRPGEVMDLTETMVMTVPSVTSLEEMEISNGSPPSYKEALTTSRPVFIPFFTRLRRCFTERDLASRFYSSGESDYASIPQTDQL